MPVLYDPSSAGRPQGDGVTTGACSSKYLPHLCVRRVCAVHVQLYKMCSVCDCWPHEGA